jgi:hypothetical protein
MWLKEIERAAARSRNGPAFGIRSAKLLAAARRKRISNYAGSNRRWLWMLRVLGRLSYLRAICLEEGKFGPILTPSWPNGNRPLYLGGLLFGGSIWFV